MGRLSDLGGLLGGVRNDARFVETVIEIWTGNQPHVSSS